MANRPPDRPTTSLPQGWRLKLALALYLLVSVAVLGGIAAHVMDRKLTERDGLLTELRHELERREVARHALEATLAELRLTISARDRHIQSALAENERLVMALTQVTTERATLEDERNLARERARLLDQGARETERWLETAQRERLAMERERAALEERLAVAETASAQAERREGDLRSRLLTAEQRLAELETEHQATARWLAAWVGERLGTIESVLERTGIETDRLLAPAAGGAGTGQGGPLLAPDGAAPRRHAGRGPEPGFGRRAGFAANPPLFAGMTGDLARLEAAERLVAAIPLATPFERYHLTSGYGQRIDPLTRRRALHNGLDFGAPAGSEVLATAAGRVIHAGRAGSYGIMVEVDHGHGITTRYAHLSRTLVEAGDHVALWTPIGIIGSTGRSTGRHLHYEVRLDGEPRDPAKFIAAGRKLRETLRGRLVTRAGFFPRAGDQAVASSMARRRGSQSARAAATRLGATSKRPSPSTASSA